jgi:hypothetical protein
MSSNGISPMVSVIVPVGGRQSPMAALYAEYKSGLCAQALSYEFIFVLDGPQPGLVLRVQRRHGRLSAAHRYDDRYHR